MYITCDVRVCDVRVCGAHCAHPNLRLRTSSWSYWNAKCLIIHLYQLKDNHHSKVQREEWLVVLCMVQVQNATLWMACQVTLCRCMHINNYYRYVHEIWLCSLSTYMQRSACGELHGRTSPACSQKNGTANSVYRDWKLLPLFGTTTRSVNYISPLDYRGSPSWICCHYNIIIISRVLL